MDYFEIKEYERFFNKEVIDIIRWDKIDFDVIQGIFHQEEIRVTAESLVNFFDKTSENNDTRKKLSRFLYPAGNFDDMLLFLRCAVRTTGCEEMIILLNQSFARANGYNEPLWIIWGRFLTDVFDVLRQWTRCDDKMIERIINNF